jgi:hypothetical protein
MYREIPIRRDSTLCCPYTIIADFGFTIQQI